MQARDPACDFYLRPQKQNLRRAVWSNMSLATLLHCMSGFERTDVRQLSIPRGIFASAKATTPRCTRLKASSLSSHAVASVSPIHYTRSRTGFSSMMWLGGEVLYMCSSPSFVVGVHNFQRLGFGRVGSRSAVATRTVPVGGKGREI